MSIGFQVEPLSGMLKYMIIDFGVDFDSRMHVRCCFLFFKPPVSYLFLSQETGLERLAESNNWGREVVALANFPQLRQIWSQ